MRGSTRFLSGFAPRYSLREARVADGDSKNRTSLVRLQRTLNRKLRKESYQAMLVVFSIFVVSAK